MFNGKKQIIIAAVLAISVLIAENTETQRYQKAEDKCVVIDGETGLVWQDDLAEKCAVKDWSGAEKYCQDLTLAGKGDWRLPNYDELIGIVNYKKHTPVINSAFKNPASDFYWSSREAHCSNNLAWAISLEYGNSHYFPQTRGCSVRCVRGG